MCADAGSRVQDEERSVEENVLDGIRDKLELLERVSIGLDAIFLLPVLNESCAWCSTPPRLIPKRRRR